MGDMLEIEFNESMLFELTLPADWEDCEICASREETLRPESTEATLFELKLAADWENTEM
jgi:hypothetical protein